MIPETIILEGGSPLIVVKTDKFKTELLTISAAVPYSAENSLLCNLLFAVLKRGCVPYPTIPAISRRLDDLYDANIGTMVTPTGENLSAGFICECIDRKYVPEKDDIFAGALDVLRSLAAEPLTDSDGIFPASSVESEKKILGDNILAMENDPKTRSYELCRSELFRGEPYGENLLGKYSRATSITREELTAFYRGFLENSLPRIIYVGSRDAREVSELVREKLGFFGGKKLHRCETIIKKGDGNIRYVENEMAVRQGKLTMGFRSDISVHDGDLYASVVMNDIFGGSAASKLFKNVREAKSLCYYCSSSLHIFKGAMFVRSGISNKNRDKVTGEVLRQFDDIKNGRISDEELEYAIKSNVFAYKQISDSTYSTESFYRSRSMYGLSETPYDAIEKILAVKKEDVTRAANRYFEGASAFIRGTLEEREDLYDDIESDDE